MNINLKLLLYFYYVIKKINVINDVVDEITIEEVRNFPLANFCHRINFIS